MVTEKIESNEIEFVEETYFPLEIMRKIFNFADSSLNNNAKKDEPKSLPSSCVLTGRMFGHTRAIQEDRIKAKLSKYISEGQLEMVDSLLTIRPDLSCHTLFTLAGFACQDKMKMILEKDLDLFKTYGLIKDISGVYPVINDESKQGITVFQHAMWAGDLRYMCQMMLDCLPNNEIGEEIRLELLGQCFELIEKGVVYYDLDGKIHEEIEFSLQPLIDKLTTYVTGFNKWSPAEQKLHWCTEVGHALTFLPAYIRQRYCDPEQSFQELPKFDKETFTRSLKLNGGVLWNDALVGLGITFGITGSEANATCCDSRDEKGALLDLCAIMNLYSTKMGKDWPLLTQRLQKPIENLENDQVPLRRTS